MEFHLFKWYNKKKSKGVEFMGLFGKKQKEDARLIFYEGELPGFVADVVCLLYLDNNILTIKRYDMDTVAKLPTDRITDIEMLGEPQFLQK